MLCERRERETTESWYQTAMIACILANQNRPKGKRPMKIEDFMPKKQTSSLDTVARNEMYLRILASRQPEE